MKYFKVGSGRCGHPQGLTLFHGAFDEGVYRRCGPYTPPLMLPLWGRLIVAAAGRRLLDGFEFGNCRFTLLTSIVAYDVDWLERIESGRATVRHWEPGSVFRGARELRGWKQDLWQCHADEIEFGVDEEWKDDVLVKVPVLYHKHIGARDLFEFTFARRLWQVVSQRLKAAIDAVAPRAFTFHPVCVW